MLLRITPIFEVLNPRIYTAYIVLILVPVIPMRILFDYLYWRIYGHRREIETQALTDPLSGLPNRRNFLNISTDSLGWHTRHSRPASLMFIDIDRFKPINDTYGTAPATSPSNMSAN